MSRDICAKRAGESEDRSSSLIRGTRSPEGDKGESGGGLGLGLGDTESDLLAVDLDGGTVFLGGGQTSGLR